MQIVAGIWGGRHLEVPKGRLVRPTADKVREALFSILGPLDGLRVLDVFAGSGALAFEALSRGARSATLIEKARAAQAAITANAAALAILPAQMELHRQPAEAILPMLVKRGERFDLILADPPYADAAHLGKRVLEAAEALLERGGQVVVEHGSREPPPIAPPALRLARTRRYGETALSFYGREGELD